MSINHRETTAQLWNLIRGAVTNCGHQTFQKLTLSVWESRPTLDAYKCCSVIPRKAVVNYYDNAMDTTMPPRLSSNTPSWPIAVRILYWLDAGIPPRLYVGILLLSVGNPLWNDEFDVESFVDYSYMIMNSKLTHPPVNVSLPIHLPA